MAKLITTLIVLMSLIGCSSTESYPKQDTLKSNIEITEESKKPISCHMSSFNEI